MENEIKVNEYVRSNQGIFIISHINIKFDDNDYRKVCLCQNEKVAFTSIDNIKKLKHSPNLIDIIEENDIGIMNCYGLIVKKFLNIDDIFGLKTKEYELLKLVTKEQFESISYKVKE